VCLKQIEDGTLPVNVVFDCNLNGCSIKGTEMRFKVLSMLSVGLALASLKDAFGNVVTLTDASVMNWSSSDESIATIEQGIDNTVTVKPTGKAGVVTISLDGDTDPSTPTRFVGSVELEYLPGEAVAVELTVQPQDGVIQVS
jgi:hypothetical protein